MKIGRGELTTDHPTSSYGCPVYVLDGESYGPEDMIDNNMAGSIIVTSDAVTMSYMDIEGVTMLKRYLRQSTAHGVRWCESLTRAVANQSNVSDFADERG